MQHPRGRLPAGFSFVRRNRITASLLLFEHDLFGKSLHTFPDHALAGTNAMTDRRPLLRAIFDAAVAAAHPDVVLGRHLPPAPKGRVICLAAGKGAAAMAVSAERHYLDALKLEPQRLIGLATTRHGHGLPT